MALLYVALAIATGACGRVAFDPLTDGQGSTDGLPAGCSQAPSCTGASVSINTTGSTGQGLPATSDHGFAGSCRSGAGAEAVLSVTIQDSGRYTFRLAQAGPTSLYIRNGCCTGPELGCSAAPLTEPVVLQLTSGQVVFAIGDGTTVGGTVFFNIAGMP